MQLVLSEVPRKPGDDLRIVARPVEYCHSSDRGPVLMLQAETPAEKEALKRAHQALTAVLPQHATRLDVVPSIRSDGHRGVVKTGESVSLHIFSGIPNT